MSVEIQKDKGVVKLLDNVTIEDAEILFESLQNGSGFAVDMEQLGHIHTACLQVLFLTKPKIVAFPEDSSTRMWLNFLDKK